jgi:hypothetical protein
MLENIQSHFHPRKPLACRNKTITVFIDLLIQRLARTRYNVIYSRGDVLSQSIVVFGIVFSEPLTYHDYVYPVWANQLGWAFACSAIFMVPVMALVAIIHQPSGSFYQVQ